ncbi:conserved exported hypothetical protein [Candidatus Sulfopaludibacter sp. SbA3]|nr:conserved exported hypothetical protein [Candidatus Sulfopaludibacter sp. SbA3]
MFRRLTLLRTVRTPLLAALVVVCLASLHAQRLPPQPVAKVVDVTGQVSVFNSDGGMQRPVSTGLIVQQTQIIETGPDGWAKFEYTDHSTFEIFPKSKVVFQEHPADFEHLLNIWIGHVKVWIQHAPGQPNYKNVNTPTAVISVRGTVFSIDVPDDDHTVVSVEEGIVDVRNRTAINYVIPLLHAGESVTVIRNQPLGLNGINKNGVLAQAMRRAEDVFIQIMLQRRGGIGLPGGGPVGTSGGPQGDKGKTTGTSGGSAPTPPAAPTPPPAPPPPGGGH